MVERFARGMDFPATTIQLSNGGSMNLPSDLADGYKIILFFRGSW